MTANTRSKTIPELPVASTFSANDRLIVHQASSNTTKQISKTLIQTTFIVGPYADDAAANAAGVVVGQPYYDSDGVVYVRLL
jgi:hypothetical protein